MVQRAEHTALEARANHVRDTFGRYMSDEVVSKLLAAPDALSFGGEKVCLSIMMTDLRGFTQMCETVPPEEVVRTLNHYFGTMTEVIQKYGGVIDDFIGDAILVIFGEPVRFDDHAARSVACALEMQLAMASVNEWAAARGLPSLEMGIGINTGDAVVGNIGSEKRAKHSVIGRTVNIAARVESYTTGGQILVSQATFDAIRAPLRVERRMDVKPKGVETTLTLHEISAIGAPYNVELDASTESELAPLARPVELLVVRVDGKDAAGQEFRGRLLAVGARDAALNAPIAFPPLTNLKLSIPRSDGAALEFYAKVLPDPAFDASAVLVRFTSIPAEVRELIDAAIQNVGECPRPSVMPPPPLRLS
jgi:adenylate cyclase